MDQDLRRTSENCAKTPLHWRADSVYSFVMVSLRVHSVGPLSFERELFASQGFVFHSRGGVLSEASDRVRHCWADWLGDMRICDKYGFPFGSTGVGSNYVVYLYITLQLSESVFNVE